MLHDVFTIFDTLIEKPPNHDNNDHTDLESNFEDMDFDDDDDY